MRFTKPLRGATIAAPHPKSTYDDLNRLSTVSEDGVLQASYTYDSNGNRASLIYANGVVESYQYNKANWVISLTNSKDGETLSSYAYTYYASGNQKSETTAAGCTTNYAYDDLGRLIWEGEEGGRAVSYIYDANSNRVEKRERTVGIDLSVGTWYSIAYDPNGKIIGFVGLILIGAAVGGAISGALDIAWQLIDGAQLSDIDWLSVGISAGFGLLSGAFGASPIGWLGQIGINALISGAESVVRDLAYGNEINWGAFRDRVGIGAVAGVFGGPGLQNASRVNYYKLISAGGGFGLEKRSFTSTRIAETFWKEFRKGIVNSIEFEAIIEFIDRLLYGNIGG